MSYLTGLKRHHKMAECSRDVTLIEDSEDAASETEAASDETGHAPSDQTFSIVTFLRQLLVGE
jgi:hypothetical protein